MAECKGKAGTRKPFEDEVEVRLIGEHSHVEDPALLKFQYLAALSFVPVNDVVASFEAIKDAEEFPEENDDLVELYAYFEQSYVGRRLQTGRRRQPRYFLSTWNQFERLHYDLPRTNNIVEGWHRGIQSSMDVDHL